jgi:phosphate:Na+ symporter
LLARFGQWSSPDSVANQIANVHTAYNVLAALLFLPFMGLHVALIERLVRRKGDGASSYDVSFIDRDLAGMPYLALAQANKELVRMSGVATKMFESVNSAIQNRDPDALKSVKAEDDKLDYLQKRISAYLARLSEDEMAPEDTRKQLLLLSIASELEHIGDLISRDICALGQKLIKKDLAFSSEGEADIDHFYQEVRVNFYRAVEAFSTENRQEALQVIETKAAVEALEDELRLKHFERLNQGLRETAETTTIHLELLEDLRRINSHSGRIGVSVLAPLLHEPLKRHFAIASRVPGDVPGEPN